MPNLTSVGQFEVPEDGLAGLPVRLYDSTGALISAANPAAARLYDAGGNPIGSAHPLSTIEYPNSTRQLLHASAPETGNWVGNAVDVHLCRFLTFFCNISAISGTNPTLQFFLQLSTDGGTTWYSAISSSSMVATGLAVLQIGTEGNNNPSISAANNAGTCFAAFGDTIRMKANLGGTGGPSATFDVTMFTM